MKTLALILALASFARGQDAISLKEAVRQSMARSKVIEASGASILRPGFIYAGLSTNPSPSPSSMIVRSSKNIWLRVSYWRRNSS